MKRILITAYDVNPYNGSESATGWNYPFHLSKDNKVTVITRENNLPEIYRFINENKLNVENLSFIGFDLPRWARFWKRGAKGSFLYLYLWQIFLGIRFFSKRHEYNLCHALNFHCDWAPSFLWLLGKPLVWGPINHNEVLPQYVLNKLTTSELKKEKVKQIFKWFFWNVDPFLYICKRKSQKILVGHKDVITRLNLKSDKCILFNQIASTSQYYIRESNGCFNVLFVGRGLLIKNYMVVLESVKLSMDTLAEHEPKLSISFIGVGAKAKKRILNRARELNLQDYIIVEEWVSQDDLRKYYIQANVLCFPSYEGAGMVIAEALSFGNPVITIANNGAAHELDPCCSFIVKGENEDEIISGISTALNILIIDVEKRDKMSKAATKYVVNNLSWEAKSAKISNIYSLLLEKK
jgi:glycosyltransferase involved in cell wall biosynthesis